MTAIEASAPGKIILLGEHAVVYGQPALAVPLGSLRATARIVPGQPSAGLTIDALDIGVRLSLATAAMNALSLTARLVLEAAGAAEPDAEIELHSTIPIASGLGSGAAVAAALARALGEYVGRSFSAAELSDLVYEVEKVHHGTPSGIDNTVVCYEQPVYFLRGQPPRVFHAARPFHLLVADTGTPSPTRETVGTVRAAWQREPERCEALFTRIGDIVRTGYRAIEGGANEKLGPLMSQNHALLQELGVSSARLDALAAAAVTAGALGAKLSGGGGGGSLIALVRAADAAGVTAALESAGAVRVIHTTVS